MFVVEVRWWCRGKCQNLKKIRQKMAAKGAQQRDLLQQVVDIETTTLQYATTHRRYSIITTTPQTSIYYNNSISLSKVWSRGTATSIIYLHFRFLFHPLLLIGPTTTMRVLCYLIGKLSFQSL